MFSRIPKWFTALSVIGTSAGGYVLLKNYLTGGIYVDDDKILGRTVIITGANSGLGKETAAELAKRGGRIIMACRDMEKCSSVKSKIIEETFNRNVECKKLDLASMKSIKSFANDININEKRLDILINNAAVMGVKPRKVTEDGFEWHFGVNYLGHFLLTNLLLDKLKATGTPKVPSRIINVGALTKSNLKINFKDLNIEDDYDWRIAYQRSKLALLIFTEELGRRLKDTNVCSFGVYPPLSNTAINRNTGVTNGLSGITVYPVLYALFNSAKIGAQTIIFCAVDPLITDYSGKYFSKNYVVKKQEPLYKNELVPTHLWTVSEIWTQLRPYPKGLQTVNKTTDESQVNPS